MSTSPTARSLAEDLARPVYRFAAMVCRDAAEAEDVAQTALERAIRALPTFDPARGDLGAWLWRIVVNAARDAGRLERRRLLLFERLAARAEPNGHVQPPDVADGDLLQAVRRLPSRQRAAVALRYGADLELRSVGQALHVSEAAAAMLVHRALRSLRNDLSKRRKDP